MTCPNDTGPSDVGFELHLPKLGGRDAESWTHGIVWFVRWNLWKVFPVFRQEVGATVQLLVHHSIEPRSCGEKRNEAQNRED
jgi:hypothetical protein